MFAFLGSTFSGCNEIHACHRSTSAQRSRCGYSSSIFRANVSSFGPSLGHPGVTCNTSTSASTLGSANSPSMLSHFRFAFFMVEPPGTFLIRLRICCASDGAQSFTSAFRAVWVTVATS